MRRKQHIFVSSTDKVPATRKIMTSEHPQNTPAGHIHQAIGQLFDNGELCDICVVIGQKEIKCHGLVLASVSQVFKKQIMANEKTIHISSEDLSPELFEQLLEILYKNKDLVNQETAKDFLVISCFLEIDFLVKRCVDILMHNLIPQYCFQVWKCAQKYKLPALARKACRVAAKNITNKQQEWLPLPRSMIKTPTLEVENLSETSSQASSAPSSPVTDTNHKFLFEEKYQAITEDRPNSQLQTKLNKLTLDIENESSDTSSQASSAPSSPEPGASHRKRIFVRGIVEKLEKRQKQSETTRGSNSYQCKGPQQEVKKDTLISSRRGVIYKVTVAMAHLNLQPQERTDSPKLFSGGSDLCHLVLDTRKRKHLIKDKNGGKQSRYPEKDMK